MIATLKPYPAYKDSGVPWLGDVPAHWAVRRAKCLMREVDERSTTGEEELLSVSHKTGVTSRRQKSVTMFLAESNVGHKVCRPGDVVVNTMWAWMAALGVSGQTGIVSPSYGVYRPRRPDQFLQSFLDELLRTPVYRSEYVIRSTGITDSRLRLYPDAFLAIPMLRPEIAEQAAIVRFLDHADRRIRRYIRAKQKLIALLNEQKQAIIHRAVTRGLPSTGSGQATPNVRLKPSGVKWLGDVPEHWEVLRGKYVGRLFSTPSVSDDDLTENDDSHPMYLKVSDLACTDGALTLKRSKLYVKSKTLDAQRQNRKCLVFPKRGGAIYTNKVGIVETDCLLDPNLMGWDIGDRFDPLYVALLLQARTLADLADVSSVPQINNKHIERLLFPAPPRREQATILARLDLDLAGLTAAISRTQNEISLLREYRTRLIADVVTGKLDVREAAARLPEEAEEAEPPDKADILSEAEDEPAGERDAVPEEAEG